MRDGSVVPLPDLAKRYKDAGIWWVAIGDENYGEGSSREHAAMEPRYMNGRAVIVRSFAAHPRGEPEEAGCARADVRQPRRLRADPRRRHDRHRRPRRARARDARSRCVLHHADGSADTISTTHTMSDEHIAWFRAGSALNVLRGD